MIDLHSHILPHLDDGAPDLAAASAMAEEYAQEGVVQVTATPHCNPDAQTGTTGEEVQRVLQEVRPVLASAAPALEILPGQEIFLSPGLPEYLRSCSVLPLGSSAAVLVEVSMRQPALHLDDTLFRTQLAGYHPILAHPERYVSVQRDPDVAARLAHRGIVLQLTVPALLGEYGESVQRVAERLLRLGAYAIASSDRHRPGQGRSMAAGHERLAALGGTALADLLLVTNPGRLLRGEAVIEPEPLLASEQKRRIWPFRR